MNRKKIILTDRDKSILCYLFEQKVAFEQDIHESFFTDKHKSTSNKRMNKLFKYAYIRKFGDASNSRYRSYYSLTKPGLNAVKDFYSFEKGKVRLKSDSIKHDLDLTKIRKILRATKMLQEYYSENYLQNCFIEENQEELIPFRRLNSDAALKLKSPQGEFFVALEYERSAKNASRYTQKLTDYYYSDDVLAIFYICKETKIEKLILNADKKAGHGFKKKVFTLVLNDNHKENNTLPFRNNNGDTFKLQ